MDTAITFGAITYRSQRTRGLGRKKRGGEARELTKMESGNTKKSMTDLESRGRGADWPLA